MKLKIKECSQRPLPIITIPIFEEGVYVRSDNMSPINMEVDFGAYPFNVSPYVEVFGPMTSLSELEGVPIPIGTTQIFVPLSVKYNPNDGLWILKNQAIRFTAEQLI